ncbi:hypothetical protein [Legionella genomosp. 1]|uniref:hypothetical protein n=1 Tax=Legionella genomosp. 1 TaxID=1093625 RepID=UPI00105540EB|nr:hypothetical protein [Legionella genomosp. 1]
MKKAHGHQPPAQGHGHVTPHGQVPSSGHVHSQHHVPPHHNFPQPTHTHNHHHGHGHPLPQVYTVGGYGARSTFLGHGCAHQMPPVDEHYGHTHTHSHP